MFKPFFWWRFRRRRRRGLLKFPKVLAEEPTSERRSRVENGERDFEIPYASASPLATGGGAAKTFISRAPYRQLRRLFSSKFRSYVFYIYPRYETHK